MTATQTPRTFDGVQIPAAGSYGFDVSHSHVGFTAKHLVVAKTRGRFSAFDGTLLFVSHDRAFLDALCTQILEVQDGEVRRFTGNYSDYHAKKLSERDRERERVQAVKPAPKPLVQEKPAPPKSAPGKIRNPYLFEKLEKRIMTLEAELKTLHDASITEEVYRNATKLRDTQMRIAEVEHELAQSNEEWEKWVG